MFRKWEAVILLSLSIPLYAQHNTYFPNFFNSYFFSKYHLSPSYIPEDGKLELSSNYRALLGELKKISAYSFSSARIFGNDSTSQKHQLRLSVFNEREGSFIQSPRGYLGYALRQRLSEDAFLHSGIQLGAAGIYYSAPTVTQSSAILPDGSVAVGLTWKKLTLDLSSHQIFNSAQKLILTPLVLQRYYHGYASYTLLLGPFWKNYTYTLFRILPHVGNEWYLANAFNYKDLFTFGGSFKYRSALSFYVAFDLIRDRDHIQLFFNYNSSIFHMSPAWQTGLELGFNYRMR
ncbi:MAG TPA: type IX secretion system membrane protein PorP/SprF [Cytophagales bacterium]|nr:type IX secretion system membrane protein PorP/SprF [Cytophagales bacterium]